MSKFVFMEKGIIAAQVKHKKISNRENHVSI